ncbi:hypothetical protein GCM10027059_12520 [Myceligenerans halotolerans]
MSPNRQPRGAPDSTGGQFAPATHSETSISLTPTPAPHVDVDVEDPAAHEAFVEAAMTEPEGVEDYVLFTASGDDLDDVSFDNPFWPTRYDRDTLAPATRQYIRDEFSRWATENRDALAVITDESNPFAEMPEVIGQAWWFARNGEAAFDSTFGPLDMVKKLKDPPTRADAVAVAEAGALLDSRMTVSPIRLDTDDNGTVHHR